MSKQLKKRISDAISLAEVTFKDHDAYPYLPEITESLKVMRDGIQLSATERNKIAGAMQRLVTEDFAFSESPFGTKLLELGDDFARGEA
jgi:hypothetical protein